MTLPTWRPLAETVRLAEEPTVADTEAGWLAIVGGVQLPRVSAQASFVKPPVRPQETIIRNQQAILKNQKKILADHARHFRELARRR